jgi:hypothetical protein
MTLKLDWGKGKKTPKADVGMVYLQKGIRWIPNYKVEIDGKGKAVIKLQATIINELADVENVKAHLVIGVPSFAFKDTADPISLGQTVSQLSQYFQESAQTGYAFSNAIMSQGAGRQDYPDSERNRLPASAETIDLGPEVAGSGKNEDLFVFTVENVSLKKGQRMVIPVTEFELSYSDIYKLTLNFTPPQQIHENFNSQQLKQLAKYLATPKPKHVLRLKNDSAYPLTTAPALILKDGKLISQGMITYTPAGADCDLEMSSAIDIRAKTQNEQKNFTPNAININGNSYSRADMAGLISITNHKTEKVKIEITRFVIGSIDEATGDADIQQLGHFFDVWAMDEDLPEWFNWYSWPWWWYHVNTLGQISWSIELEPDEKVQLEYSWHYFWL